MKSGSTGDMGRVVQLEYGCSTSNRWFLAWDGWFLTQAGWSVGSYSGSLGVHGTSPRGGTFGEEWSFGNIDRCFMN